MTRGSMLLRAGFAAFIAVMLAGPGAAVFPSTLRWAAWIACPKGTAPTPRTFQASYHRPGEHGIALYCVSPGGTEHERTLAAMGGLWLMYFTGLSVLFSLLALRGGSATTASRTAAGSASATRDVPPDVEAKARELVARDQKIHAIKIIREATGMGLKEAKDWVEALPLRPARGSSGSPAVGVGSAPPSAADRLAELKRMLDAGLITTAEYEAKKGEILAEL